MYIFTTSGASSVVVQSQSDLLTLDGGGQVEVLHATALQLVVQISNLGTVKHNLPSIQKCRDLIVTVCVASYYTTGSTYHTTVGERNY